MNPGNNAPNRASILLAKK